ncbi:probable tubulin polyglutamylase TTLL9 isoform X10 [Heterocephalus glaber]|uniref:Tubulin--tyrosine ligase-like protein 9 n=1 Tax=Heterocephalus glaber TaxID=10181 RepID=A0AAX6SM02_HETGA|nr:probable tubulin polyglutamylase TTLL9 isoform X10 [Heterocephalus glaber]
MSRPKNQSYKGHGLSKGKEREQRASIRFKTTLMNTVMDVLHNRPGWVEVKDEGEWDFYWCDVSCLRENFDHTYMDDHVRISHFRNHYEVARSQGKGIFLFRRLKDITDWRQGTASKKFASLEAQPAHAATTTVNPSGSQDTRSSDDQKDELPVENYVAQRYIENPYLIGGRKFDLRVYVLVMSYLPLRAWLYRDGFARFSNTRFTLSSIDDQYVHLTNVAVQKMSPDYHPKKGCKWMLQHFRQYLASKHGPQVVEALFSDMDNIFIKSLQSVQKVIISDKHCFELYGYDILIDQDLKPWLLEVNASPSLTASSQEDYELKTCLLEDTLHVVDMEARLTGKEKRVGGFDLMWNDGPVSREEGAPDLPGMGNFVTNTHLGMQGRWEAVSMIGKTSCSNCSAPFSPRRKLPVDPGMEDRGSGSCHPALSLPDSCQRTSQHSSPSLQAGSTFAG